jgi:hypothetical protein
LCQNSDYLFIVGLNAENPKELEPLICLMLLVACDSRFGDDDDDIDESSILSVEPPRSLLLSLTSDNASGPEDIYSGNTLQRNVFDFDIDPFERRFSLISGAKL